MQLADREIPVNSFHNFNPPTDGLLNSRRLFTTSPPGNRVTEEFFFGRNLAQKGDFLTCG
jgi:hypothetical protein